MPAPSPARSRGGCPAATTAAPPSPARCSTGRRVSRTARRHGGHARHPRARALPRGLHARGRRGADGRQRTQRISTSWSTMRWRPGAASPRSGSACRASSRTPGSRRRSRWTCRRSPPSSMGSVWRPPGTRSAQRWGVEFAGSLEVLVSVGDATAAFTTPEIAGQEAARPVVADGGTAHGGTPGGAGDAPVRRRSAARVHGARHGAQLAGGRLSRRHRRARRRGRTPARLDRRAPRAPDFRTRCRRTSRSSAYVPSRAVLSHAALHITHGGANSVHESLAAGVPMVCLPQGDDHHLWAERVRVLGAGVGDRRGRARGDPRRGARPARRRLPTRRRAHDVAQHLRDFPGEAVVMRPSPSCSTERWRGSGSSTRACTATSAPPAGWGARSPPGGMRSSRGGPRRFAT